MHKVFKEVTAQVEGSARVTNKVEEMKANTTSQRFKQLLLPHALSWVVTGIMFTVFTALAQSPTAPVHLTFDKSDVNGDGVWEGPLSGDMTGDVEVTLGVIDQSTAVWLVEITYVVNAPDVPFTVKLAGTFETSSSAVRANGVVIEGNMRGAVAEVQAQHVDPDNSRFKGFIRITPSS